MTVFALAAVAIGTAGIGPAPARAVDGWVRFVRVHVEQRRFDSQVVVDAAFAGVRWRSQPGVTTGDHLLKVDASGFVRSLDNTLAFTREPIGVAPRLDVAIERPGVAGTEVLRAPHQGAGRFGAFAVAARPGASGNAATFVDPYQPAIRAPMDFEVHIGQTCRADQYVFVGPEWTRTIWITPPGVDSGTYRVRMHPDGTTESLDGRLALRRATAPRADWDHELVGVYIAHACDPEGDGTHVVGYDRWPDGGFTHMTTWSPGPDGGYGFQPWGDPVTRPRETFGPNWIVRIDPDRAPPVRVTPSRLTGPSLAGLAAAVSRATFGAGAAGGAVVARQDVFADGLAGIPLAAKANGPVLVTSREGLAREAADELTRAVRPGATVHLLGGPDALAPAVEDAVRALGFRPLRLAGPTRIETAVAVAEGIGPAAAAFVVSAWNFPDALAAGSVATAVAGGVHVLLTDATVLPAATGARVAAGGYGRRVVFGGPAVVADAVVERLGAERVAGPTRVQTATEAGRRFRPSAPGVWLAAGSDFVGGVAGGAMAALHGGVLLMTDGPLDDDVRSYLLAAKPSAGFVLGELPATAASAVFG